MWTAIRATLSQWYIAGIGFFLIAGGLFLASHWSSAPAPVAAAQNRQSPTLEIAARAPPPTLPAMPKATATAAPSVPSIQQPSAAAASAPALDHTMAQSMTTAQAQPASYPLAGLFALWFAGRVAILGSAIWGAWLAAAIDVAFLVLLAAAVTREIVAGNNKRHLRILVLLGVLIAGNIVFHLEAIWYGSAEYGTRLGIAAIVALISLVGGRIVPSFTHNWLARSNPGRLPVSFSRFDAVAIGGSVLALVSWIVLPQSIISGAMLIIAGLLQAVRLLRWAGDRTLADRLVLVLHVAYAFVPIGFLLLGAAILWPADWPVSAGLHTWMAGAAGLMTLAVMTRASLAHTGCKLVASRPTQLIYLCALVAALVRIFAAFEPSSALLHIAAFAWVLAFGGFAAVYGPLLMGRAPVWAERA